MALFYQEDFQESSTTLNAEESRHLAKVLRIKAGEHIEVTDGRGHLFTCEVLVPNQKSTNVNVLQTTYQERPLTHRHIAIAPTKNLDRIEWFMEKAVEFGIDELSFILCHNSERRVLKTDRIERKAVSAMKQSRNLHLPKINELIKLGAFIKNTEAEGKFIAFVDFENTRHLQEELIDQSNNLILIGPEGDFSSEEVTLAENEGFLRVSLGDSRLRTETAGVATAHILNLFCK